MVKMLTVRVMLLCFNLPLVLFTDVTMIDFSSSLSCVIAFCCKPFSLLQSVCQLNFSLFGAQRFPAFSGSISVTSVTVDLAYNKLWNNSIVDTSGGENAF